MKPSLEFDGERGKLRNPGRTEKYRQSRDGFRRRLGAAANSMLAEVELFVSVRLVLV